VKANIRLDASDDVILSEAKDLLFVLGAEQQVPRR
jgi:hypothetical protein